LVTSLRRERRLKSPAKKAFFRSGTRGSRVEGVFKHTGWPAKRERGLNGKKMLVKGGCGSRQGGLGVKSRGCGGGSCTNEEKRTRAQIRRARHGICRKHEGDDYDLTGKIRGDKEAVDVQPAAHLRNVTFADLEDGDYLRGWPASAIHERGIWFHEGKLPMDYSTVSNQRSDGSFRMSAGARCKEMEHGDVWGREETRHTNWSSDQVVKKKEAGLGSTV